MTLEIVSPEAKLYSGEITSVTVPGIDGEFQMLNHHAAIVSILAKGAIKVEAAHFAPTKEGVSHFVVGADKKHHLAINSGTLEMNDNKIIILVD
ncbi:F0F1 ATP synthase subunit epsilon [Flavobacterium sp.]|jgi:F-type H+-transporting ATPase subunit epsilon|uniref:F0F1 ATP synthase subunit epsilon n=1 Tax=Flavobacterium sp. TaxID=239 RepID=UPI0037BE2CC3